MPEAAVQSSQAAEVATSYFGAMTARDADAVASHWHDDGVDDIVPVGILRGPGEVREFFAEVFAAVPDAEVVVERVVAEEGVAVVQWRLSGTFSGGLFQGIEPTGRRIELRGVDCLEIEEGKIVRNSSYYDGMAFARGIGMLPSRDSGAEKAMFAAFNAVTRARDLLASR